MPSGCSALKSVREAAGPDTALPRLVPPSDTPMEVASDRNEEPDRFTIRNIMSRTVLRLQNRRRWCAIEPRESVRLQASTNPRSFRALEGDARNRGFSPEQGERSGRRQHTSESRGLTLAA